MPGHGDVGRPQDAVLAGFTICNEPLLRVVVSCAVTGPATRGCEAMPAGTMTARRAVLRWLVMPAVLISLAAGLGSVVPAPHAVADAASMTGSSASLGGAGNARSPPMSPTSAARAR